MNFRSYILTSDTRTKIARKKHIYKIIIIMDEMGWDNVQCITLTQTWENLISDLQWGVLWEWTTILLFILICLGIFGVYMELLFSYQDIFQPESIKGWNFSRRINGLAKSKNGISIITIITILKQRVVHSLNMRVSEWR